LRVESWELNKKTRIITLSALFSALCLITLYIASIWPTGLYGLVAFASLFVAAAVIETGAKQGVYVFIVCSVLGFLLLPDKSAAILYILFFGYYPVVKNLIERIKSKAVQWIFKLMVFNAALTVIWVFLKELLMGFSERLSGVWIIYVLGNVVFVLFDYGYSNVLLLYVNMVSRRIRG